MIIFHVHLNVKPDKIEAFKVAASENANGSVQEPGNLRFDVLQQQDDPTQFVFVEIYESAEARQAHYDTPHFKKWKEVSGDLIESRSAVTYTAVFPTEIKRQ